MNYVPLWVKTDYSILSSLIKIDDLIDKLISLNITSCAICDDNLFGAMEFYNKCTKKGIKPIIGLEINIDFPILLYAKNYEGYQALCRIDTLKNKGELYEEMLYKELDNLIVVIPFEHLIKASGFIDKLNEYFIGYSNLLDAEKIEGNKVYIKKIMSLSKKDEEYLPYLYKIKDENYTLDSDVTIDEEVDISIKKDTMYFSNMCNLNVPKRTDLLPIYNENKDFDEKKYLTDLCVYGLKKRLNGNVPTCYVNRLKYELDVIAKMGFCNYFLVVWDYVKYAKKNGILVGPGRGSAASSLVSYSLGITDVDPIRYNLLFERFLNPERITMPDIDIDFDADKRGDVIDYVVKKYGKSKVCYIITFSNLLAKQVIRDLARIFEAPTFKIDSFLKNFDDKKNLKEQLSNPLVKRMINEDKTLSKIYEVAIHLEGLKRHTSLHAAGIVISNKDLFNYVPLTLNSDGTYVCGYTMNYIEDLGLLKMDFLGLKNLTVISNVMEKIDDIKFNDIPLDDKKTFELFCNDNVDGVFQFESKGMRNFVQELKPSSLKDLIAAVALFRPGPMSNIPHYVARKNKKEKITYIHEDLKDILEDTYGIIIYQEQIMQIASKMAGFTYGEADVLRRAMSKKKEDVLLAQKDKFIKGSINKGYDEKIANEVYELILKFANYGFNKAHSVCYAIIGYKIAYLKVHYPNIFMCEILNNYIGLQAKTKICINECKRLGVKIVKPDINLSSCKYIIKDNELIYPLSLIKEIGTLTARQIENERLENGDYTSYLDFVKRNYKLGRNVIRNIILSGALDSFKKTRKTLIENMDEAINYAELCSDLEESLVLKPEIKEYDEYSKEELTKHEIELYGFYISNHPTSKYITDKSITTKMLEKYFDSNVTMTLYFERKNEIDTKNKEKMMFITASDQYETVELVMFPKIYTKYFNISIPGVYKIKGKVEKRFSKFQVVLYEIERCD